MLDLLGEHAKVLGDQFRSAEDDGGSLGITLSGFLFVLSNGLEPSIYDSFCINRGLLLAQFGIVFDGNLDAGVTKEAVANLGRVTTVACFVASADSRCSSIEVFDVLFDEADLFVAEQFEDANDAFEFHPLLHSGVEREVVLGVPPVGIYPVVVGINSKGRD